MMMPMRLGSQGHGKNGGTFLCFMETWFSSEVLMRASQAAENPTNGMVAQFFQLTFLFLPSQLQN